MQVLESEQTVARLKRNAVKYKRMIVERRKLSGFLKGLEAGKAWAHSYLLQMHNVRLAYHSAFHASHRV